MELHARLRTFFSVYGVPLLQTRISCISSPISLYKSNTSTNQKGKHAHKKSDYRALTAYFHVPLPTTAHL